MSQYLASSEGTQRVPMAIHRKHWQTGKSNLKENLDIVPSLTVPLSNRVHVQTNIGWTDLLTRFRSDSVPR